MKKKMTFPTELRQESLNLKNLNYLRKQSQDENLNTLYKAKKKQYDQNLRRQKQLY